MGENKIKQWKSGNFILSSSNQFFQVRVCTTLHIFLLTKVSSTTLRSHVFKTSSFHLENAGKFEITKKSKNEGGVPPDFRSKLVAEPNHVLIKCGWLAWVADTESTRNIWYTVHIHTTRPLDSSKEEPITDTKITNIKKSLQSVLVEIVDFLVLFSSRFMSGE